MLVYLQMVIKFNTVEKHEISQPNETALYVTLPADLKNCDFEENKKRVLPNTTGKILVFGIIKDDCKLLTETEQIYLFICFLKHCLTSKSYAIIMIQSVLLLLSPI